MNADLRRYVLRALLHFRKNKYLPASPSLSQSGDLYAYKKLLRDTLRYRELSRKVIQKNLTGRFEKLPPTTQEILGMAVCELLVHRIPHYASVHSAVELTKKNCRGLAPLVNGVLRKILRNQERFPALNQIDLADVMSKELSEYWKKMFSKAEQQAIISDFLDNPPVHLRPNLSKVNAMELKSILSQEGLSVSQSEDGLPFLRTDGGLALSSLASFKDGLFYIQNPASFLPVLVLQPQRHESILDACAAPGGKTTAICEMAGREIQLTALDQKESAVRKLKENLRRLGHLQATVAKKDVLRVGFSKNSFDRILLDAPCSSWGTLRRHPEGRWIKAVSTLKPLVETQRKLFSRCVSFLKPNGVIVFSVCTFSKEETEDFLAWMPSAHPNLRIEGFKDFLPERLHHYVRSETYFQSFPFDRELDAFFIARFRKLSAT